VVAQGGAQEHLLVHGDRRAGDSDCDD
jgi:hypothetical protein